ncbi:glycosyltransferase family 4 protein [Paraglaciecola aquimarina]|uniref:Glycosyltransferase family 4 protein n=1 Tax=Paraglaciecola aquimarina TaxID=1235557 RepID=A0ABU3SYZ7_9ALTE|nr:glycosyltransferase family 4 protein [Paraglaciecola aquimarina]MDU0355243.1 glycosyltransferase family 4 protein [Paraglaciecola aquimarina]
MTSKLSASTTSKTLLILGYVWPEPNSSAAGGHMMSLIQFFLGLGYDITYASPAQQGEHKFDLQKLGVTEISVKLNCGSFDTFVTQLSPDLVLFDRFMLEEQFGWRVSKHCPNAIKILDTEDLHSLRHARQLASKQKRSISADDLNQDLAKREIAAIFRCDLTLVISEYEMALLQQHFAVPAHILCHCPFMLDLEQHSPSSNGFAQRQHFISIGNFRHEPNWDAVLCLKQTIWPLIRKQLPKAELHIYGAYPPPKATQLHNVKQGFLVKGWAVDAKQVMQQARVCLAPLRFGAGLKGKLAEAMWCGTPNVTTTVGAEGMTMGQLWGGYVSEFDTSVDLDSFAQEFATLAVNLYSNATIWHELQMLGYQLIQANFDKRKIQPRLAEQLTTLQHNLPQHRSKNFIGQMLQHHHLKSTQYMSQWIEAKNKHT